MLNGESPPFHSQHASATKQEASQGSYLKLRIENLDSIVVSEGFGLCYEPMRLECEKRQTTTMKTGNSEDSSSLFPSQTFTISFECLAVSEMHKNTRFPYTEISLHRRCGYLLPLVAS